MSDLSPDNPIPSQAEPPAAKPISPPEAESVPDAATPSEPPEFPLVTGAFGSPMFPLAEILGKGRQNAELAELREQLAGWFEAAADRERKRDQADLSLRSFFTEELEKLRSAIQVELRIRAAQQVLRDLLPVLNDLDDEIRATETQAGDGSSTAARRLQATRRRIYNALRKLGIEQIPVTPGETEYSPEIHECADVVAAGDSLPPGRVAAVKRHGYFFRGELYQAPLVIVAGDN